MLALRAGQSWAHRPIYQIRKSGDGSWDAQLPHALSGVPVPPPHAAQRGFHLTFGPPAPWLSEPWSSCLPSGTSRTLPCQPPPALTPRAPCVSHMCCFLSLGRPDQGRVENTDRFCARCRDRHHSCHPVAPRRPCVYRTGRLPQIGSPW